jgi:dGTPase
MINLLVTDLVRTSAAHIAAAAPASIDDVRRRGSTLISLSPDVAEGQLALKQFLRRELYAHPHVQQMTERAHATIRHLFASYSADFDLMPAEHAARAREAEVSDGESGAARIIADYIAGMTDRFALEQHSALLN